MTQSLHDDTRPEIHEVIRLRPDGRRFRGDEQRVVDVLGTVLTRSELAEVTDRLRAGAGYYGALYLDGDPRDFLGVEARQEILDGLVYAAAESLRVGGRGTELLLALLADALRLCVTPREPAA